MSNSLSMVDFLFYEVIEMVLVICEDKRLFVKYPNLAEYHLRISKNINKDKIGHFPFFPQESQIVVSKD